MGTLGASAAAARPQKMALPAWPDGSRLDKGDDLPQDLSATCTASIPRENWGHPWGWGLVRWELGLL